MPYTPILATLGYVLSPDHERVLMVHRNARAGDRQFLPLVFDGDPRPFHGVMPYRDGRMQSWHYERL